MECLDDRASGRQSKAESCVTSKVSNYVEWICRLIQRQKFPTCPAAVSKIVNEPSSKLYRIAGS